jgi:2-phospho-L-lactate/phosphoenolpyruvate guanylyltransferase
VAVGKARWTIIIPVKPPAVGKSRLRGSTAPVTVSDDLVAAIALDTIAAACSVDADIVVVTGSDVIEAGATSLGAKVLADQRSADGSGVGLNPAIRHAEAAIGLHGWRAAMAADLPSLRSADLRDALDEALRLGTGRTYVSDHHGVGTTMLSASPGVALDPVFGGASAGAHAASGARPLGGHWPSLRLDVDTAADLQAAEALGLGPRTRRYIVISERPTTAP